MMRVAVVSLIVLMLAAPAQAQVVPYPPGFFDAEQGTVAGEAVVNLTWDPPSDTGSSPLEEYRVYRATAVDENAPSELLVAEIAIISAGTTDYTDTDVVPGLTYLYFVTAVNTDGWESLPSNPVLLSNDYPHCLVFGWTLGPPPDYILQHGCLLPPPV